ncbi:MAG: DUF4252 domain-containing protein [Bacteroidales bacterium]|nr:DUF4252 domain-containing protein [Bacteroidales bacterium]MBP5382055.1 DUF4252 domain-containing protein [Bacteroidales bacterium]
MIPCLSCVGTQGEAVSKPRISKAISECRNYEGAEYIKLGRFATGAIKGIVRLAGKEDPDAKAADELMSGIKGVTVLSYDDCSEEDKASIISILTNALADSELLIEASDSGEKVKIYGSCDEGSDIVRDFVLFAPSESALICIKGFFSMETIARIATDD